MHGNHEIRHPLVGLIDETSRLQGRLKSVFAQARQTIGLNDSEFMVLNAVVEARQPPTVAQIGRSLGHPRQLIQRAANSLVDAALIEPQDNPDHKRSPLFVPTARGEAMKRKADALADKLAADLLPASDLSQARQLTASLRSIRQQLEVRLRTER